MKRRTFPKTIAGFFAGLFGAKAAESVTPTVIGESRSPVYHSHTDFQRYQPIPEDILVIETPPSAPDVQEGYVWLKTGWWWDWCDEREDYRYKVTRQWILSGPAGWHTEVYK